MQNKAPIAREARPPLPEFVPVPRKYRHDGWTPERQKAFIEALADTGCVSRAAGMVNMAQANCYTLRRAPGAEAFRRAWEAARDFGVQRLKDIAFERAIDGQMVPVFVAGKLMGFRRKRNDGLLMFCLRHYGMDSSGKRTTVNYFSSRAGAASGAVDGCSIAGAGAEASTTTIRTVISDRGGYAAGGGKMIRDDRSAETLNGFDGVDLDETAQAEIQAALEACAARHRQIDADQDVGSSDAIAALIDSESEEFVRILEGDSPYWGELESGVTISDYAPFAEGEHDWTLAGLTMPEAHLAALQRIEADTDRGAGQIAEVKRPKRKTARRC